MHPFVTPSDSLASSWQTEPSSDSVTDWMAANSTAVITRSLLLAPCMGAEDCLYHTKRVAILIETPVGARETSRSRVHMNQTSSFTVEAISEMWEKSFVWMILEPCARSLHVTVGRSSSGLWLVVAAVVLLVVDPCRWRLQFHC